MYYWRTLGLRRARFNREQTLWMCGVHGVLRSKFSFGIQFLCIKHFNAHHNNFHKFNKWKHKRNSELTFSNIYIYARFQTRNHWVIIPVSSFCSKTFSHWQSLQNVDWLLWKMKILQKFPQGVSTLCRCSLHKLSYWTPWTSHIR